MLRVLGWVSVCVAISSPRSYICFTALQSAGWGAAMGWPGVGATGCAVDAGAAAGARQQPPRSPRRTPAAPGRPRPRPPVAAAAAGRRAGGQAGGRAGRRGAARTGVGPLREPCDSHGAAVGAAALEDVSHEVHGVAVERVVVGQQDEHRGVLRVQPRGRRSQVLGCGACRRGVGWRGGGRARRGVVWPGVTTAAAAQWQHSVLVWQRLLSGGSACKPGPSKRSRRRRSGGDASKSERRRRERRTARRELDLCMQPPPTRPATSRDSPAARPRARAMQATLNAARMVGRCGVWVRSQRLGLQAPPQSLLNEARSNQRSPGQGKAGALISHSRVARSFPGSSTSARWRQGRRLASSCPTDALAGEDAVFRRRRPRSRPSQTAACKGDPASGAAAKQTSAAELCRRRAVHLLP